MDFVNRLAWRGRDGSIRWGYHLAASMPEWTMTQGPRLELVGTVTQTNPVYLSQSSLTFVVNRPDGRVWTWPIQTLEVRGSSVSAELVQEALADVTPSSSP